ncbi:MAG: hypothetical protein UW95_C0005G0029 [Parcubacteria group bacterium GW2011_GWC1_45_14]|nr:MAG: hypothetical protein UW87_C0003G0013 [Candidatus Moranbacteria bacterium GW2011_GWC2_45_10]KKT95042.1 MAG: hypothetical protein UW95_C0005G0029 [Parcubacteria group bacterium GW2011_GWC1_45_14]
MERIIEWLVYEALGLEKGGKSAEVLTFFSKDMVEIMLLLVAITFFMSLLRHYLPIEKLKDFLAKRKLFGTDYFLATVFGAITPFCSCSSIPLFIGFVKAGIPLGVTFAFLITSPLINEVALTLFIGLFGWKVTLLYVAAGILVGMIGGWVLGKLGLEKYVEDYIWKIESREIQESARETKAFSWEVLKSISKESFSLIRKIGLYVLIGVGLGAVIHGYVPEGFFEKYITKSNPFAVPLAVILAVPLYSNASGVLPIIESLVAKGIPLGTALAFMMATVGLSLPEALILKKVMKLPLLLAFFGVVAFGMILIGYGFNLVF